MNVNSRIINALKPIGLPVVQDVYDPGPTETPSNKWITFNYAFEDPEIMADNKVLAEHTEMQVHLIVPKLFDYFSIKNDIKQRLVDVGFSISSIRTLYETDTKRRHILFECSILG